MKKLLGGAILVSAVILTNQVFAGQFDYLQNSLPPSQPAVLTPAETIVQPTDAQQAIQNTVQESVQTPQVVNTTPQTVFEKKDEMLTGSVNEVKQKVHFGKSLSNTDAQDNVDRIGRKLMKASNVDKYVSFIFSEEVDKNAYNDAQGNVVVFRGIIDCCEDEAELAFIIGHELGHAVDYHVAKSMAANTVRNVGEKTASYYTNKAISPKLNGKLSNFGINATEIANKTINKAGDMAESKYGRTQENDADIQAMDFMVKAGYNPLAGVSVLYKIGDNYADLFADHPSTDKRVITIYKYVKEKYPQYAKQGYNTEAYKEAAGRYYLR